MRIASRKDTGNNSKEKIMSTTALAENPAITLRKALEATQKTVTIEIAAPDLETLKKNDFRLCFAKKVGDNAYNVVWQSYDQYLGGGNAFSWTPQYELFGTNTFAGNVVVTASTNTQPIGLGEECVLDAAGNLGAATSGGPDTGFTLVNKFGTIHPGVNQVSTGIDGNTISTPIYVAQDAIIIGSDVLTPVEKVLVWFEQNIETSTMFSDARSLSQEIDMTLDNAETWLFSNQKWLKV